MDFLALDIIHFAWSSFMLAESCSSRTPLHLHQHERFTHCSNIAWSCAEFIRKIQPYSSFISQSHNLHQLIWDLCCASWHASIAPNGSPIPMLCDVVLIHGIDSYESLRVFIMLSVTAIDEEHNFLLHQSILHGVEASTMSTSWITDWNEPSWRTAVSLWCGKGNSNVSAADESGDWDELFESDPVAYFEYKTHRKVAGDIEKCKEKRNWKGMRQWLKMQ